MSAGDDGQPEAVEPVSDIGKVALSRFMANREEVGRIMARLCQLFPVGSSFSFLLDFGQAKLVAANGQPIGRSVELIQISRPAAYIEQAFTLSLSK